MGQARCFHRITAYKNQVIVTGGVSNENDDPINSVEVYNCETQKWVSMPSMKYARHSHASVVYESLDKL